MLCHLSRDTLHQIKGVAVQLNFHSHGHLHYHMFTLLFITQNRIGYEQGYVVDNDCLSLGKTGLTRHANFTDMNCDGNITAVLT